MKRPLMFVVLIMMIASNSSAQVDSVKIGRPDGLFPAFGVNEPRINTDSLGICSTEPDIRKVPLIKAKNVVHYKLEGREARYLPELDSTLWIGKTVSINIVVEQSGKVRIAKLDPMSTNTTDRELWGLALEHAKKSQFSPCYSEQKNTIQYGKLIYQDKGLKD